MASLVSCALCEDKSLFCLVQDIWWLCARCTSLEYADLGRISNIKLRKVSVDIKKIAVLPSEVKLNMCEPETAYCR